MPPTTFHHFINKYPPLDCAQVLSRGLRNGGKDDQFGVFGYIRKITVGG